MQVQMRRVRRRWKPYLCLPNSREGNMGRALGQNPSMRNREGQYLVLERLCIGSHHPEGTDDQLTRLSVGKPSIPPKGSQDHQMNTVDACHHGEREILADLSTIDDLRDKSRTPPRATGGT